MNEAQKSLALAQWDTWMDAHPLRSPADSYASSEVWLAATENMLGDPLSVGNLQAKISELEERLRTLGGKHSQQVRDLEYQIAGQASLIKDRNNKIHDLEIEIQDWKKRLDDYSRTYQAEMEDRHQDEMSDAVASAVSEALNEAAQQTAQALEEQKEHFEQVKEAALSAQSQVLRQEFEQRFQHTVLEQDWLPRAEHLGAMRHQKEDLEESPARSQGGNSGIAAESRGGYPFSALRPAGRPNFHPDRRDGTHSEGHGGHRTPPEA
jgi:hypothetical protein